MAELKGEIALVTGASSGIGEVAAQRLATAGYKVYGTSRRGARLGQRLFEMLPLDVTRDDSVDAAVRDVFRLDGRIVLKAARAARPKLRYTAGRLAGHLRLLRRFAPAGVTDAGNRRDLRLDAPTAARPELGRPRTSP